MIFYAIYKNQETHFTILVALLQGGPQKDLGFCNVAPGAAGRRGEAKFRRAAGRGRPGAGGGWPADSYGSIPGFAWGWGAGVHARRSPTAVAAGPRVPANRRPVQAGQWPGRRR
jgi:hypothetical protein